MESKKIQLVVAFFVTMAIAITVMCAYGFYTRTWVVQYPGSEMIFKRYYEAEHNLKAVSVSDVGVSSISTWFDNAFAKYTLVDKRDHDKCTSKNWKNSQESIGIIICDHGQFRTILTTVSP